MSEATGNGDADPMLAAFFGRYLPSQRTPSLTDFRDLATFRLFDDAIRVGRAPRPSGLWKQEFLREATACLEHVLVKIFDAIPLQTEFGRGVKIGDVLCNHEAWVAKCFSNSVADSIRAKCAVLLGSDVDPPVRADALKDAAILHRLCADLGCPDFGPRLHETVLRSMELFEQEESGGLIPEHIREALTPYAQSVETRRAFKDAFTKLWLQVPDTTTEMRLAVIFTLAKLQDYAQMAQLNSGYLSQSVPQAAVDRFQGELAKGWPFSHLRAGFVYLQDCPVGPNGEVFKVIWRLWKHPRSPESDAELVESLELLLRLLEKKGFHHDISDFRRIMRLIPLTHAHVLLRFKPEVAQGCYTALAALFRRHGAIPYPVQIQLVDLLDTARGKVPNATWEKKLANLRTSGYWGDVVSFAKWLRVNSRLTHHFGPGKWPDDVFKRFLKASSWILAN